MPLVDGFTVSEVPGLRSPVVIMAFTGWSDTGTVTVDTAQHLVDAYNGEQFLTVDPEDYYVFTDSRPHVRIDEEGVRRLDWPKNEAYFARMPDAPNDLVIVMGAEPNLRWRTFSERLTDAISALNPSLICTLVARPAATPHTRPIPVTGSSADPRLAARFGLGRSLYQGPTGILGVLHDSLRRRGANLISLAAGVPHYPPSCTPSNPSSASPRPSATSKTKSRPSPAASRKLPVATTRSPPTSAPSRRATAKATGKSSPKPGASSPPPTTSSATSRTSSAAATASHGSPMTRPNNSSRLVYSTDSGRVAYTGNRKPVEKPGAKAEPTGPAVPDDGVVRVHRQKAGRGGKTATLVTGLPGSEADLDTLLKALKAQVGAGGTREGRNLVIQGDLRERLAALLESRGYRVKLAGG